MSLDTGIVADENWLLNVRSNVTFLSLTKFEELRDPQNRLASRVGKWKATGGSPPVNKFPVKTNKIINKCCHFLNSKIVDFFTETEKYNSGIFAKLTPVY